MSEESFEFFDTDRFFDKIAVYEKDGCGKDAILSYMTNERSDFCHDRVICKNGLGSHIGTLHTLIIGLFVIQVDIPRGGDSTREAELIDNQYRGAIEG